MSDHDFPIERYMHELRIYVAVMLPAMAILYLAMAFVCADLNFVRWAIEVRVTLAGFAGAANVFHLMWRTFP